MACMYVQVKVVKGGGPSSDLGGEDEGNDVSDFAETVDLRPLQLNWRFTQNSVQTRPL